MHSKISIQNGKGTTEMFPFSHMLNMHMCFRAIYVGSILTPDNVRCHLVKFSTHCQICKIPPTAPPSHQGVHISQCQITFEAVWKAGKVQ